MSDQLKIQGVVEMSAEGAENALDSLGNKADKFAVDMTEAGRKAGAAVDEIGKIAQGTEGKFSRSESAIVNSIKRLASEAAKAKDVTQQMSNIEFNISSKGLDAEKFRPMISVVEQLQSEYTALAAKERELAASNLFQKKAADAANLVKATEYARFWEQELQKVEEAERRLGAQNSFVESLRRQSEALGKTRADLLEMQASQLGVSDKAAPFIAKLRESEAGIKGVGMSAAQTTAALRNVPAQMTDIVVSLQGGQAPMTVLLQQGGQLKDMFGGIGAAAKAVGGYVVSLINPFTLAAAAAAGIGYAFYSGSSEAGEFRKNLILTGNAAGLTVDRFNAMSKAIGSIDGVTRGAAAEALTAMAASGNISAASMERLTATALRFQQAGGPAVADTVKQFEALGKEPVKASVELSEKTHYLTLAVYEQIKSLEEQGKSSEAAALAQKTWADALDQRTPQMVQNIGLIETAWINLKRSAAGAWDWAKDIGRDSTSAEMISALKNKIAEADKDIASGSINSNRLKQQREQWKSELAELVAANIAKEGEAKRHADAQKKEEARIAATAGADKLIESQRSKREQYSAELKKLDEQRSGDLISEEKYQQAKAALAKKYEEKPRAAKADKVENAYNSILDSLNKQLGSAEKLNAVEKLNVELQEKKYAKLNPAQKENLLLIAQQIDMQKQAEVEGKATLQWIADGADAQKKALKSLNDELEKSSREVATYGMSRGEIAEYDLRLIDEQIAAERALNEEIGVGSSEVLRQLELQRSKRQEILGQARKLDQLDAGKKAAEDAKRAAEEAAAAWQKTIDRIDQTFHDSFSRMLENGKADWDAFGKSLATSFKTAVADEIYKLTIKPIVVSVVSSFAGGAAQAAGSVSGQSGSGIGGVVQGVQAAYGAYNSGISNAATAFATSGAGQYMGLSTAGQAMGPPTAAGAMGYTSSGATMTSSGSTAVASAGWVAAIVAAIYSGFQMQKSGWFNDNSKTGYEKEINEVATKWVSKYDRLFGHNRNVSMDASGIVGTFDMSGFEGQNWQDKSQKGGTFRSDKRWTDPSAINSDLDKFLDSALKQTVSGLQTIGKTLNIETVKAMEGFSHEFKLQLTENGDASKAGEKIAAELGKVSDELVKRLVPTIGEFSQFGESATQTFQRLNQEVQATDAILLAMGKDASEAFGGVGLASIAARENLIDLAGGIDKLANKTQFFYSNFYSPAEQIQLAGKQAQKALDSGFADLGLNIPGSREAFRSLVESQDLSTEAGRKLFNSLLDLSDEFDTATKATEALAEMQKAAGDTTSGLAAKQLEAITAAKVSQGTLFDTFATDSQKLAAAQQIVDSTFASIGKTIPANAAEFLKLAQSIDPATEAGQGMIAALIKVKDAFAYTQSAAEQAADTTRQARENAKAQQGSLFDTFASNAQKLDAASRLVSDTFASIGKTIPANAAEFLKLAQSIDPATEAGQGMIAALIKVKDAFAYTKSAADAAAQSSLQASRESLSAQAGNTESAMQQLADTIGGMDAPVITLTDKLEMLQSALAASYSKDFSTGVDQLNKYTGWRDQLSGSRESVASAIADAQLRVPGADVVGLLKSRENALWDQLAGASDKGKVASLIQQTLMQRINAEADLQRKSNDDQAKRLQSLHDATVDNLQLQKTAADNQRAALQDQISSWQKLTDISQRLRDTVAGMSIDSLSSLDPFAQLDSAKSAFESALTAARGGDANAASKLGELGNDYRSKGREVFASSERYAGIDSSVRSALASVADMIDKSAQLDSGKKQIDLLDGQSKALDAQLKALNDSYSLQQQQLDATVNTAAREIELLSAMDKALAASQPGIDSLISSQVDSLKLIADQMQYDSIDLTGSLAQLPTEFAKQFERYVKKDESREILRQQLSATQQQLADEKARYEGMKAMHKEQMEQLQLLNARIAAIESNGALAGAGA